ncbi:hypothetical protein [Pseudonocardia adelaidensis]|uniref:Uncharacterized protein n=1 Tax=Pseudonocardia adelaidensis TaxID=648754 RepID=A0ABP9NRW8_9PSEU
MSPLLVEAVPAGTAVIAVPAQNPAPPPGQGEEFGKASPVALVVILTLALVTILLIRGMSKRIRRLPGSFEKTDEEQKGDKEKADGGSA